MVHVDVLTVLLIVTVLILLDRKAGAPIGGSGSGGGNQDDWNSRKGEKSRQDSTPDVCKIQGLKRPKEVRAHGYTYHPRSQTQILTNLVLAFTNACLD